MCTIMQTLFSLKSLQATGFERPKPGLGSIIKGGRALF
jgi:hypothetical protein